MKMYGNDLTFMTCDDLQAYQRKMSLSTAGVVVKLLKVRNSFSSCYLNEYFKFNIHCLNSFSVKLSLTILVCVKLYSILQLYYDNNTTYTVL